MHLSIFPVTDALLQRLKGPGGIYNAGNVLGFGVGLCVAISSAHAGGDLSTAAAVIAGFLAGSPAATALTAATGIFFWSGEVYHQAWKNGFPPDASKNHRGDLLSGFGAVALGVGLSALGSPLLAASSGFLHAAGKFGSALHVGESFALAGRTLNMSDVCREAVLLSRMPAFAVAILDMSHQFASFPAAEAAQQSILPATMLVCYGLWAIADVMLMSSDCALFRPVRYASNHLVRVRSLLH